MANTEAVMLRDAIREFLERMWKGICEPFAWLAEQLEAFKHRISPTEAADADPSISASDADDTAGSQPRNLWGYVQYWIQESRNAWHRWMDPLGSEHLKSEDASVGPVTVKERLAEYKSQLKHQFGIEGDRPELPEVSEQTDPSSTRGGNNGIHLGADW